MTPSREPIAIRDREGEPLWFNHDLLVFKATCAQTGGAFILLEQTSQRGKMTPLPRFTVTPTKTRRSSCSKAS